jgi:hypothetical protein
MESYINTIERVDYIGHLSYVICIDNYVQHTVLVSMHITCNMD